MPVCFSNWGDCKIIQKQPPNQSQSTRTRPSKTQCRNRMSCLIKQKSGLESTQIVTPSRFTVNHRAFCSRFEPVYEFSLRAAAASARILSTWVRHDPYFHWGEQLQDTTRPVGRVPCISTPTGHQNSNARIMSPAPTRMHNTPTQLRKTCAFIACTIRTPSTTPMISKRVQITRSL